jgi:hypothetical protein
VHVIFTWPQPFHPLLLHSALADELCPANGLVFFRKWRLGWAIRLFGSSSDKGSYTSLFAATAPVVRAEAHKYKVRFSSPSRDCGLMTNRTLGSIPDAGRQA